MLKMLLSHFRLTDDFAQKVFAEIDEQQELREKTSHIIEKGWELASNNCTYESYNVKIESLIVGLTVDVVDAAYYKGIIDAIRLINDINNIKPDMWKELLTLDRGADNE